ncbi:MAG: DUF5004 domain-containing protein [Bacteroidia bacterium]|jgi:hypothetical protein|nr:DUF5004 domain-containing protein [Bacteroidia bacterium]
MKINNAFVCLIFGIVALSSCRKEYKEIGEVPSKVEGISASWVLQDCAVIDKASIVEETLNITPYFSKGAKMPNIRFQMEGTTGVYQADTTGVLYSFFGGTSGTWQFDNADFPTKLILTPTGSSSSITMPLASTIRPTDTYLKIDQSVLCNDKVVSVYRLTFIRN